MAGTCELLLGGNGQTARISNRDEVAEMPKLHHNLPCLAGMGPAYKVFFRPTSDLYSKKQCTRGLSGKQSASRPDPSGPAPRRALTPTGARMGKGITASLLLLLLMTGFGGAAAQSASNQPRASGMEPDVAKVREAMLGNWESNAPEIRPSKNPDGSLKPFYLKRAFKYLPSDRFDLKLESIGRQIFEGALEVERLERAVRVLARPYLRSVALPVSEHRFPDFRYVWFHAACPRLIAGGLRRGSAESCHQQKQQQRRRDAFTHARSSRGQSAPWCRAGRIRPRCALLTRQTPRTLLLAIEIAGRPEKDFVSWAHACETWEIVMELRHLRYFIAVADAGSLTVAAEQKLTRPSHLSAGKFRIANRKPAFN